MTRRVEFFISPNRIKAMETGEGHPFFSRAKIAFESVGLDVKLRENTDAAREAGFFDPHFALYDRKVATHDLSLDVRPVGIGPFYRMEKSPVRANYRLVDVPFDPESVLPHKAKSFFRIWRRIIVKAPVQTDTGVVLVALQGKLLKRRSQQVMSPVDMIAATLAHDPSREIWLKPHPKEMYTDAEMAALHGFAQDPRVRIFDGNLDVALHACDYIVTQNSAVLLRGMFYERPAIVFADCEYHHPFQSVRRGVPVEQAFARVMADRPDFAAFAYWYLQLNCINTSRDWAEETILSQCRGFGWDI